MSRLYENLRRISYGYSRRRTIARWKLRHCSLVRTATGYMTSIEVSVAVTTRASPIDWLEFVGSFDIVHYMTAIDVSVAVTISEFTSKLFGFLRLLCPKKAKDQRYLHFTIVPANSKSTRLDLFRSRELMNENCLLE